MRSSVLIVSFISILVIVLTVAGLLAPRWWPDGVLAYSNSFSQIIEAEARRRQPKPPLLGGPHVSFTSRVDTAQAAAVPALVAALAGSQSSLQEVALDGLDQLHLHADHDRAALDLLAQHALHPQPAVRASVINVLGRANSHRSEVLIGARDAHASVRGAAMLALGHSDDPAVIPLIQAAAFFDHSPNVQRKAVQALCAFTARDVVPILLAVMERNGRGDVGRAGAALLRHREVTPAERTQVIRYLVTAMRSDQVGWNGLEAEDVLMGLPALETTTYLREALADADRQCRQAAAGLLQARGDDPSDLLIAVTLECLRADADDYSLYGSYSLVARSALEWLITHPNAGTPALRTLLDHGDSHQRFFAAWLLGMRSDHASSERIGAILIPLLRSDGAANTAIWAIRALYRLGPIVRPAVDAALPHADAQQAACIRLLLRDWTDPPRSRADAARRGRVALSVLYHDPAWEPTLEPLGSLPRCLPSLPKESPKPSPDPRLVPKDDPATTPP